MEKIIVFYTIPRELFIDAVTLIKLIKVDNDNYEDIINDYPYDYILDLYRITSLQLHRLLSKYAKNNNTNVFVEYRMVEYK